MEDIFERSDCYLYNNDSNGHDINLHQSCMHALGVYNGKNLLKLQ